MEGAPENLSALLLTDEPNGRHGTIFISEGRYVSGADLKDANYVQISTGYDALKTISGLVTANFKYITAPPAFFQNAELTLNIEIEKILLCLPELPEDASEFHDSDSLLDRVFSPDVSTLAKPARVMPDLDLEPGPDPEQEQPQEQPQEQKSPVSPAKKKKTTWHSVPVPRTVEPIEEEPGPRYTSLEERALQEVGPPGTQGGKKKKKSFLFKIIQRIGYFFYSLITAPAHMLKKLAKPVILPLCAIAVLWQIWTFVEPKIRAIKLPSQPAARHSAPERGVRSAPVYHAPQPRRTAPAALPFTQMPGHPYTPPVQGPTIQHHALPPVEPAYVTPAEPLPLPHRRAYQAAPPHEPQ
jgi:hypothetical protein